MGPSGSGKSTLMHILAGLDKPTTGDGLDRGDGRSRRSTTRDLTKLRRRHIGFVFQFFNLLPMLTAEENIALPLSIAGEKPDPDWFADLIDKVGLGRPADAPARRALGRPAAARRDRARARLAADRASSPTSRPATSTRRRAARSSTLMRDSVDELRPDDGDGHARCARGGDRRPDPLPRRRPDRPRPAPLRAARGARGDGGARSR